jgi:hypothetical protein
VYFFFFKNDHFSVADTSCFNAASTLILAADDASILAIESLRGSY